MKAILHTAKIAMLGMQEAHDKSKLGADTYSAWLAYKVMLLDCLDELMDRGMSEKEAKQLFCQFLN